VVKGECQRRIYAAVKTGKLLTGEERVKETGEDMRWLRGDSRGRKTRATNRKMIAYFNGRST